DQRIASPPGSTLAITHPLIITGVKQPLPLDAAFVTGSTLQPLLASTNPTVTREVHLRVGSVSTADASGLVAALGALTQRAVAGPDVTVGTQLPALVAQAGHEEHLMAAVVTVVSLELVLLTLLLLFGLLSRTAEAREGEVALAKLRGFGPLRVLRTGLAQPTAIMVGAFPLGIGLAFLVVWAEGSSLLVPGTPVGLPPLALGAGAAAVAGGLLAAVVASRRILVRPVADQLRTAARPGLSTRAGLALDVAALALAAAGIVELSFSGVLQGGAPDPLSLFAPALIALAAGVLGARALPRLCRLALAPTRTSWALGTFLALRQVVRRPAIVRQVVLLAVALGLATFAVVSWAVARDNRAVRATFDVGASRVLTVRVPTLVDLEQAVRRADPGGGKAMAAVEVQTPSTTLLAVDASRLAAVASWPAGLSERDVAAIARYLRPPTAPPVVLRGQSLAVTADLTTPVPPPLDLQLVVAGNAGQAPAITLGPLRQGTHRYEVPLPGFCARGCRLVSLTPMWQPQTGSSSQTADVSLVLRSVATRTGGGPWRPVDAGLADPRRWRTTSPDSGVQAALGEARGGHGLVVSFHLSSSLGDPSLAPATVPPALPAVITPDVAYVNSQNLSSVADQGLDGNGVTLDGQVQVPALPHLGSEGSLVDLTLAQRAETGAELGTASDQVWLSPLAGPGVVHRLEAQGLSVLSVERASTHLTQLDRGGLALAGDLFLIGAAAAAILALGTVVFSFALSATRRATELTALRAMGVRRRTLLRALLGEQLVVLGAGGALGVAAGLGALVLALPSVPELIDTSSGPPLQLGWPGAVLGAFLACAALLLAATAVLATLGVLAKISPARLRVEAE
ncbi:MAG: FtsX-like permease family protein, partial [Acidimicrobiales bacterium]